ncbi:N(2)-fixation sustaining protein CowN [Parathalassolituus penaei]|uniref:N(2)-fixation sustaining protein CowN n=1 Tax=Parathalassolituus penaei TaxID=2997323 RepID=A0A9X3ITF1_9GAMM|nr:N(2)-fixation sustaining protein CowN [Parathalassolituus penaei]MCY0967417.1 N(2)-fixation sustaining protein CowN [Parathalassolituus penaei]
MTSTDRYVSFCGIDCDGNARQLMDILNQHLVAEDGDPRWCQYFRDKQLQQQQMGQDSLYFVGAQMNNLYSYLEGCGDEIALQLLWKLEQECC